MFFDKRVSSLGITVLSQGQIKKHTHNLVPEKRELDYYSIVHIIDGAGSFESKNCPRTRLSAGDSFFLFPNEWHTYGPEVGEYWNEYWIIFTGPTIKHFHREGYIKKDKPIIKSERDPYLDDLFMQAMNLGKKKQIRKLKGLSSLVFEILNISTSLSDVDGNRDENNVIYKITDFIQNDPTIEFDFEELSSKFGVSYSLMRKRFKEIHGMAPYQFVVAERMKFAGSLLADGYSVQEAGFEIGMEDPYHFSRLFKKTMGKSPREFARFVRSWNG